MLVIGGGYIGLEMGTVYANMGTKSASSNCKTDCSWGQIEISFGRWPKDWKSLFEDRIFLNTKVGSVSKSGDDKVEVTFEGPAKFGSEKYDRVLISVGRSPSTRNLGLENLPGIQTDQRGFIAHNDNLQTGVENIYVLEMQPANRC